MPTISKIRFTNVVYESGNKRYADEIFCFDGENSAIILENGGGKTVFIQAALQAILPRATLANRKVKDTFVFDDGPAHIAIEWIKNDHPRVYALTAITLFPYSNKIASHLYVYEYAPNDAHRIENLPFTSIKDNGEKRITGQADMKSYYMEMSQQKQSAHTFSVKKEFNEYIEKYFQIIADEWKSISVINATEGGVESFFESCQYDKSLYEKLLIPTVERSIANFEGQQFADIFEKHREQFKMLKQLIAQLKEYDSIQSKLSFYVKNVETLHGYEEQYKTEQQEMKAYYALLTDAIEKNINELKNIDEYQMQLENQKLQLEIKQKSYDIAMMENELQTSIIAYEKLQADVAMMQEKLKQKEAYFGNIKYANEQQLLQQAKQRQRLYEEELQQIEHKYTDTQLLAQLNEVKAKLHGQWLKLQEKHAQQLQEVNLSISQQTIMLEEQQKTLHELTQTCQEVNRKITELQTTIKNNQGRIDEDILYQPPQVLLERRMQKTKQSQEIDEQIVRLKNEQLHVASRKSKYEEELVTWRQRLSDLKETQAKVSTKFDAIEAEHQKLMSQLLSVFPRLNGSLYVKEKYLLNELTQMIQKNETLYAEKLHKERLAFRRIDDYGQQLSFFADPYIATQLPQWSNNFKYLETAIDYVNKDDDTKLPVERHLLALTLVTTKAEKEKLEQLLLKNAKDLTYPIQVWTLDQAIASSEGKVSTNISIVQPALWQELSDIDIFEKWKQKAQEAANNSKLEREKVGKQQAHLNLLLNKLTDFYAQYPFTIYQQLEEEQKSLERNIYEASNKVSSLSTEITNRNEELQKLSDKMIAQQDLKKYCDQEIEKLLEYEKLMKQIKQLQSDLVLEQANLEKLHQQYEGAEEKRKILAQELVQLNNYIETMERKYDVMIAKRSLYEEVTSISPQYSNESYDILAQQFHQISDKLKGIQSNREQLQQQINQQKQIVMQHQSQLSQLRVEYSDIDESFKLPLNYEEQLKTLPRTIKQLKNELFSISKQMNAAKEEKDKQEGAVRAKRAELDECVQFDIPLSTVKVQLDDEQKLIKIQESQLSKEKVTLLKVNEQKEKWAQQLRNISVENQVVLESIVPMLLTPEEENDFNYHAEQLINKLATQLANSKKIIERQKN